LSSVASFNDALELDCKDEFTSALKQHAMKWMCLGSINVRAHHAMEGANATIDSVMTTLPTSDEARTIVTTKVPLMLQKIQAQQAQLTEA
jgi:hypothetical protein